MSFFSDEYLHWGKEDRAILVGVLLQGSSSKPIPPEPAADAPLVIPASVQETGRSFLELLDVEESLSELERLVETLGGHAVDRIIQKRSAYDPGTLIGKGKALEIKELVKKYEAHAVVFDETLSPSQMRNLEEIIECRITDRTGVILEIFNENAKTSESKTQVEIARMKYVLPRLAGMWTHLERQHGGGSGQRGMGEKQIEHDRRLLKSRIAQMEKKLIQIKKERQTQRKRRKEILKVALVGYTNAGKSTLLNALTQSDVLAEDRLFATLDSAIKTLNPQSRPKILLIDTVGFIKKLPPDLVASFKSTLEEIREADMILHVVDVSHTKFKEHIEITEDVLKELGCEDKPGLLVLNKSDLLEEPYLARISARSYQETYENTVITNEKDEESIQLLREKVMGYFYMKMKEWEVLIPYEKPQLAAKIHEYCHIEAKDFQDNGIFFKLKTTPHTAGFLKLTEYLFKEGSPS